jgi:hypothetical protein
MQKQTQMRTRTDKEIIDRIKAIEEKDFLGFERTDLLCRLSFNAAKEFRKPNITESEWGEISPRDRESILAEMLDYMPFAWEKANNKRGISAGRSMSHYSAWTWLIGDNDFFGDLQDYEFYGKDNLIRICEKYGWDHSQWDDGVRENS